MAQAVKDTLGVGGHVYGHGAYFAEAALYSHFWFGRKHPHVNADGITEYTLILAHVLTGRSKDFGPSWAPDLSLEPTGYHSVCGTEADQQVPPVVSIQAWPCATPREIITSSPAFTPTIVFHTFHYALTLLVCLVLVRFKYISFVFCPLWLVW